MRQLFFIVILGISSIGASHAQIGVNSTDPKVTLDVQAKATDASTAEGLAAPRLDLAQLRSKDAKYTNLQTGAIVYVTGINATPAGKTLNVNAAGYYYFDGAVWQNLGPVLGLRFFYMPSVVLTTNTADPTYDAGTQTFTVDLYRAYSAQFGMTVTGSSVKNPGATTLAVAASNALDYFITYFDNTVYQNVAVDNDGVLTYKLAAGFTVTDKTFMNIVFKVK